MRKILIAEESCELCEDIAKQLGTQYCVTYCNDGEEVVEGVNKTDPDILVLDLELPNIDSLTILNMLRSAGKNMPVIVLTSYVHPTIAAMLEELHVSLVYRKPCRAETLVCGIRRSGENLEHFLWMPETEVDNILMMLGFCIGPMRYENVRTAIMLEYSGKFEGMNKSMYPAVVNLNGGNVRQVEKSIRDAIRCAYKRGDRSLWAVYFPFNKKDQCPSNEVFIARIACALQTRERLSKVPPRPICTELSD